LPFSFATRFLRLSASETSVSMTGISMSGPTTVDTATIGIEANAVKAIAIANSKVSACTMKRHGGGVFVVVAEAARSKVHQIEQ